MKGYTQSFTIRMKRTEVLTLILTGVAVSIMTMVYPKVVLTDVFILTVVYIQTVVSSLSDSSQQHSPHFYFHVIFISAYPTVRVNIYAYVNMLGRNDLITALIN